MGFPPHDGPRPDHLSGDRALPGGLLLRRHAISPLGRRVGSNATYNVIGFAGFELTGCRNPCVKNLQGVFRQAFFLGPTGTTSGPPSTPGGGLGIQLIASPTAGAGGPAKEPRPLMGARLLAWC